ncbi:MAG: hypothetical protein JWP01_1260 [Myxococcales bacterium]|nr:hypothetical protein [Myxococcales bacterium]
MLTRTLSLLAAVLLAACPGPRGSTLAPTRDPASSQATSDPLAPASAAQISDAIAKLTAKHGAAHQAAIRTGVEQAAKLWRAGDGDLAEFCVEQFVADPAARDALFAKLQATVEQIRGHVLELGRTVRWGTEVEDGPMMPVDQLLATYDLGAHVVDDLFTSKVAFSILLNFPLSTLAERIQNAERYSRRTWAELRLTGIVDTRVPGELAQAATAAEAAADQYVAGYNLWMHHVLGEDGKRRFPSGKRLISHWNLRDELKANYADADGMAKQRTIAKLMERIVTQTIPAAVINNPRLDWDPFTNKVTAAAAGTIEADAPKDRPTAPSDEREPDTRFAQVIRHFAAARAIDKYSPIAPTRIDRAFEGAELSEERVRKMLVEILESPHSVEAAREIERRLGRKLEPHDLWYEFGGGSTAEAELDAITRKRYPTAAAFAKDLPRILRDLGFTEGRAKYLADHIAVDPSRGAGHAMGAERRGDQAHLRTRVEAGGMDYKGYNIAVHELGHNVEQTFSLYDVDYTLLSGVPNTAFTEALAFLFQARDLELLGRPKPGGEADRLRILDAFWNTREIAGSALVEIDVWHWLYEHPTATAAELREATGRIAREVWDRYYAPTLGGKGTSLLGIYSHTIASPLYLFNYVVGHLIAFQIEEHVEGKDRATFATEFERVCRLGNILPDLWMQQATGKPVSSQPLLDATARALKK